MASPRRNTYNYHTNCYFTIILLTCMVLHVADCAAISSSTSSLTLNSTLLSNQTLQSPGLVFEVGFYNAGTSQLPNDRTVAIWYSQTISPKTVVWMADRSMNLSSDAYIYLSTDGDLQVYERNPMRLMWTSNTSKMNVTMATVLDTGNLVLLNGSNEIVWQSFDSPTDTLLPNQTYTVENNVTLYAWQKSLVWTPGNYTLSWGGWSVTNTSYQSPPGLGLLSLAYRTPDNRNLWYNFSTDSLTFWHPRTDYSLVVLSGDGGFRALNASGKYEVIANSSDFRSQGRLRRLTLDVDGNLRMYSWFAGSSTQWSVVWTAVADSCNIMGYCGPFALCDSEICSCPKGFQFIDPTNTRQGCVRTQPLTSCNNVDSDQLHDVFLEMSGIDYPFGGDYEFLSNVAVEECLQKCLANCLCQAASGNNAQGGNISCYHKKFTLINGRLAAGTNTYIKVGQIRVMGLSLRVKFTIVVSTIGPALIVLGVMSFVFGCFYVRKEIKILRLKRLEGKRNMTLGALVRFTYDEVRMMTEEFSEEIGSGGYGTVFLGEIGHDGKASKEVVAVKRLDNLDTGGKDFVNEVDTIGRIHHTHLVHLLGYCSEANHKMLVYEYMPNLSLDKSLFRTKKSKAPILEWRSRFRIAIETAKALAYLHEGIREQRIIHCDVKPENILLDSTFSAKVGDFGMSRIMDREKTRTMTMHVRGTRGYVAPEWLSNHQITIKSDVYSFGMVLLEIVGGRRNLKDSDFDLEVADPERYYPAWAFSKLHDENEQTVLEVLDPILTGIANLFEVRRALRVGIWCINDNPHLRPSMSKVVRMLEGHTPIELPVPRPEFFEGLLVTSSIDENTNSFTPRTVTSMSLSAPYTPERATSTPRKSGEETHMWY